MITENLLRLPAHERRYITVVPDDDFAAQASKSPPFRYRDMAFAVIPLLIPGGPFVRVASHLSASWVRRKAESIDQPERRRRRPLLLQVPQSAATNLTFSSKIAEPNKVYAVNPYEDKRYYVMGKYHQQMHDHKLSELERILNALGATEYTIDHYEVDKRSGSLKATTRGAVAGAGLDADLAASFAATHRRSGTSQISEPKLPGGLSWYHDEPSWQALAESRITGGRRSFETYVSLDEDYGVTAALKADVKALKLDIGADFKNERRMVFHVKGTF